MDAIERIHTWTRNVVRRLVVNEEQEALNQQVEELTINTSAALEESSMQEQAIKDLCARLKSESSESTALWEQVDYLSST